MNKTLIINISMRIRLDEDVQIHEVLQNAAISFQDTTGKADIDEAHILDYSEVEH